MPKRAPRKNFIYLLIFTALFFLCAPFIILYSLGYDLGKNFSLFKTGGIYVSTGESEVQIFVDEELSDTTNIFQKGILLRGLSPGLHNIHVVKNDFVDWSKNIQVEGEKVAEAYPFFIPDDLNKTEVPKQIRQTTATTSPLIDNPEYFKLLALFDPVDTKSEVSATTTLEKNKVEIQKEGNSIRAFWKGSLDRTPFYFCLGEVYSCKNDFVVYASKSLGHFDFYPERNDVILVSSSNKLLALEFDKRPPQNIINLYTGIQGKNVEWRIVDSETLVVKEDKKLTTLKFVSDK